MGRNAVAERLTGALREADRDRISAGPGEQPLGKLFRQIIGDDQFAGHAGRALGVAGADRMLLARFDRLALPGHGLNDIVDRGLLVGLRLLDAGTVAQIGHWPEPGSDRPR
ncbi:hypothetical protein [Novosphingobium panipatense]|uniref:hypothetical protein n=1 Tax=Novosphingobium panipatense TaxID=428991 RepID=UPI003613C69C